MKRSILFSGSLIAGLILVFTPVARAQMVGLPVMDTSEWRDAGSLEATPGMMFGNNMDFIGVRGTVTVLDDLRIFGDVGRVDVKDCESDMGLQAGALFCLAKNDLADLGVRGTMYYVNTDKVDLMGANMMMVFSGETVLESLYCYGGGGVDLSDKTYEYGGGSTELNPSLALGLSYFFNENFSLFTEVDYVDGIYFGLGLSVR